mgnify:CR=1 FL=1
MATAWPPLLCTACAATRPLGMRMLMRVHSTRALEARSLRPANQNHCTTSRVSLSL